MRKFFNSIPKVFFAVLCYLFTLGLAIASGFFTFSFYSESQTDLNYWVMGGLAIIIELVKITLSVSYPFMKYRDYESEKKVLRYLKICFFLSIMASLYFFMSGGEIDRSPASKMTELIYLYMPILNIIPLKFTQFITTMSLSILVEAFIIFLPCIAPIMFLEKDYNRKRRYNIDSSIDKIKMILTTIPVRFIDRLYDKVVVNNENMAIISEREKKEIKPENLFPKKERPQLKLIKSTNYLKLEPSKPVKEKNDLRGFENKTGQEKKEPSKLDDCNDIDKKTYEYKEREDAFSDAKVSDEEDIRDFETARKLCIEAIKDLRKKDVCPSVDKISKHTGLKRDKIREVKKVLEQEGYIRTEESERKTYILSDYLKGGVKV